MEKVLELGIFHFSVYTFQGCGRQEINSFVLNLLKPETRNLEWLEFKATSNRLRETPGTVQTPDY